MFRPVAELFRRMELGMCRHRAAKYGLRLACDVNSDSDRDAGRPGAGADDNGDSLAQSDYAGSFPVDLTEHFDPNYSVILGLDGTDQRGVPRRQ